MVKARARVRVRVRARVRARARRADLLVGLPRVVGPLDDDRPTDGAVLAPVGQRLGWSWG